MTARLALSAAVTSAMVVAATGPFAWALSRYAETRALHYAAPLVVLCTLWLLVLAFAVQVAAELGGALVRAAERPPARPPVDPVRQAPPPTATEVTLIDLLPATTQEIPLLAMIQSEDWRPAVSGNAPDRH